MYGELEDSFWELVLSVHHTEITYMGPGAPTHVIRLGGKCHLTGPGDYFRYPPWTVKELAFGLLGGFFVLVSRW